VTRNEHILARKNIESRVSEKSKKTEDSTTTIGYILRQSEGKSSQEISSRTPSKPVVREEERIKGLLLGCHKRQKKNC